MNYMPLSVGGSMGIYCDFVLLAGPDPAVIFFSMVAGITQKHRLAGWLSSPSSSIRRSHRHIHMHLYNCRFIEITLYDIIWKIVYGNDHEDILK